VKAALTNDVAFNNGWYDTEQGFAASVAAYG
jgi:hypothetical protein